MSPEMMTMAFAVGAFLLVVISLTVVLMAARAKLVNSGAVRIDINDGEKIIEVPAGTTLLNTLAAQKIFIPQRVAGVEHVAFVKYMYTKAVGRFCKPNRHT